MFKRKRVQAAVIAFCMVMTLVSMPVFAQVTPGKCGETVSYSYDFSTNELTITGTGDMKQYSLTSPAPWYSFCEDIVSLNIKSGVESIGSYAFYYCENLKNITIPSSVKSIGMGAFYSCKALTGITIPNSVKSIGKDAFQFCVGLKEVSVPGSVTSIGERAFSDCDALTKATIQDGVEIIGKEAFSGCGKLTYVTLPNSIKIIGVSAFQDTGLYDLYEHTGWNVCYIGDHLIAANQSISGTCTVNPGTKTIAGGAFDSCGNLEGITIPDSVVSIGNRAFFSCRSLKSITIPKNVTSIGDEVFYNCFDLASITVDPDNPAYCSENGVLYDKEKTEIIRYPKEKSGASFTIPGGVIKIADGAFSDCQNLKSITIPDSVTSIGDSAFLGCISLTNVTIPDGLTNIGYRTFYNCRQLTNITIPNSVLIIDTDAFEGCTDLRQVYYIGSESEWDNEVIGAGKYVLTDIGITHLSGISARRSENGNIVVKPIKIAAGKSVILALYDGDKFVEMQQSNEYSETNREITFTPTKTYTRAKVMIWNSLNSMSPVCGAYTVK